VDWTVSAADDRARLDHFLSRHAGCSRAEARRLIEAGRVRVNGRRAAKGAQLTAGARVELEGAPPSDADKRPLPQPELPLEELWSDDALVAINKPPGQPTHPLKPGERGTAANAIVARHPECADVSDDPREGGVVHRLDVDTSGVLVAARTREDWRSLRRAFAGGQVEKEYLALVAGAPPDRGVIDAPLAHAGARKVKALATEPPMESGAEWSDQSSEWLSQSARPARTEFRVLARGPDAALVSAVTRTGRMHQIRAHFAHLGHPLYGDALYGGPPVPTAAPGHGHVLHAARIRFPHPRTEAPMTITAPLPAERARIITVAVGPIPT
jgi:23S rRNA pseudouridine1911/1915/1917 synthase